MTQNEEPALRRFLVLMDTAGLVSAVLRSSTSQHEDSLRMCLVLRPQSIPLPTATALPHRGTPREGRCALT